MSKECIICTDKRYNPYAVCKKHYEEIVIAQRGRERMENRVLANKGKKFKHLSLLVEQKDL